jgi:hypothetical protein
MKPGVAMQNYGPLIQKSGLSAADFLLCDSSYVIARIAENVTSHDANKEIYSCVKFVLSNPNFESVIPLDLKPELMNSFLVYAAANFAELLPDVEPNILTVSDLTGMNRNLLAGFCEGLANVHLIDLRRHAREALVIPTTRAHLYADLALMNGKMAAITLKAIAKSIRSDGVNAENLRRLEDVEAAFHDAELAYGPSTINHQIIQELRERVMEIQVYAKKTKAKEIAAQIDSLVEILNRMASSRAKATRLGLSPTILEDEGERLGSARVFRVK